MSHDVVFLGGPLARASVRIRCLQIAEALGCEYRLDVSGLDGVPTGKRVFVCVKPELTEDDLGRLQHRGKVIWDVHDHMPPERHVDVYLACSQRAASAVETLGDVRVIPQHHCNFSGVPNPADLPRRPAWVGRPFWCPDFGDLGVNIHDSNVLGVEGVIAVYRRMGLALNVRRQRPESELHLALNDGGKLMNTMAFGIPSISSDEPAYHEFGEGCTVFAPLSGIPAAVSALQRNDKLYESIRNEGLERAKSFHISAMLRLYKELLR